MKKEEIIHQLKEKELLGRSGSCFPTGLKWEIVKGAWAEKKYIVCNGSEGEPGVFKDGFLLENYLHEVINGVKVGLDTIDNSSAFVYLRKDYYKRFKKKIEELRENYPITVFEKKGGYLAGEETSLCQAIEGKRPEPRIKPPFPTESGLWGYPTLVNNLETFYHVSKISKNEYQATRFYSLSGEVKKKGVWEMPEESTVREVLEESGNYPDFDFFVQSGGGAMGEILLPGELDTGVIGPGGIIVYNSKKTKPGYLLNKWVNFFLEENCDKCVPCREGMYRIAEALKKEKIDKKLIEELIFNLKEASFCALGKCSAVPFETLINKFDL